VCSACAACGRPTDRLDLEDLCPDCSLDGEEEVDTFEWCDACAPEPCSCGGRYDNDHDGDGLADLSVQDGDVAPLQPETRLRR